MKYLVSFLLFFLSLTLSAQGEDPTVHESGAGMHIVSGNPNELPSLRYPNVRFDAHFAYDARSKISYEWVGIDSLRPWEPNHRVVYEDGKLFIGGTQINIVQDSTSFKNEIAQLRFDVDVLLSLFGPQKIVFFGFGQSNADGRASVDWTVHPRIFDLTETGDTIPSDPNNATPVHEAALAHVKKYPNDTVYVLKIAEGGTSIDKWDPNASLRNRAEAAIAAHPGLAPNAVFWSQGERDRPGSGINGGQSGNAADIRYYERMRDVVYPWIAGLFGSNRVIVSINEVYEGPGATYSENINGAFYLLADDPNLNIDTVTSGQYPTFDGLHFTAESTARIGAGFHYDYENARGAVVAPPETAPPIKYNFQDSETIEFDVNESTVSARYIGPTTGGGSGGGGGQGGGGPQLPTIFSFEAFGAPTSAMVTSGDSVVRWTSGDLILTALRTPPTIDSNFLQFQDGRLARPGANTFLRLDQDFTSVVVFSTGANTSGETILYSRTQMGRYTVSLRDGELAAGFYSDVDGQWQTKSSPVSALTDYILVLSHSSANVTTAYLNDVEMTGSGVGYTTEGSRFVIGSTAEDGAGRSFTGRLGAVVAYEEMSDAQGSTDIYTYFHRRYFGDGGDADPPPGQADSDNPTAEEVFTTQGPSVQEKLDSLTGAVDFFASPLRSPLLIDWAMEDFTVADAYTNWPTAATGSQLLVRDGFCLVSQYTLYKGVWRLIGPIYPTYIQQSATLAGGAEEYVFTIRYHANYQPTPVVVSRSDSNYQLSFSQTNISSSGQDNYVELIVTALYSDNAGGAVQPPLDFDATVRLDFCGGQTATLSLFATQAPTQGQSNFSVSTSIPQ